MKLPFFTIFMIFIIWYTIVRIVVSRKEQKMSGVFWEKENKANFTRKKDISQLEYIIVPYDTLPFDESAPPEIQMCQDAIMSLKDKKILNLTGISNTDLKIMYGAANLEELSLADSNYTTLVKALNDWALKLLDENETAKAMQIFEYAVSTGSDISSTYISLARLYCEQGEPDKIEGLIKKAETLNSLTKAKILSTLRSMQ